MTDLVTPHAARLLTILAVPVAFLIWQQREAIVSQKLQRETAAEIGQVIAAVPPSGPISTPWGGPLSITFVPDDSGNPEGPGTLTHVIQARNPHWCREFARIAPDFDGFRSLSINGGASCTDSAENTLEIVTHTERRPNHGPAN